MTKKLVVSLVLMTQVFLGGCSKLNQDFDCPAPNGGTCKRMDQVYEMVNGKDGESKDRLAVAPSRNPMIVEGHPGDPLRYGEGVMRLWIAPYEDTDGNYHQANQVYSVVREGHWIQNPPVATK